LFGDDILAIFAVKQILDIRSCRLEYIEQSIVIFFEIVFVPAAVKIMFDQSSERSSSSYTELIRTGIEEYRDQLVRR